MSRDFLLDANVLADFQRANHLKALVGAAQRVSLAVVEQVFDEVTLVRQGDSSDTKGRKRAANAMVAGSALKVIEVAPGTRAAGLISTLLGPTRALTNKDKGEMASIAAASERADLTFVTGDKNALFVALNELHGPHERVMRIPVFVRYLVEQQALPGAVAVAVAERVASHGAIPSWWSCWLNDIRSTLEAT